MPKMVLKAAFASINGVDRSSWCNKVELTAEVEEQDVTVFTSLGWQELLSGIAKGSLALGFRNDVAANQLDETMWALFIAGANVPFAVRATQAAKSSSNPEYSGSIMIKEWKPIAGGVGEVNQLDVSYPTSGIITRATT